jgi:hypothetical protein
LLAACLAACGSDSGDSTATAPAAGETTATAGEQGSGGSAEFRTPGGDNSIQSFGEEADAGEIDAATAVLGDYLRARSKGDLAGQCASLAHSTLAPLEELASRSPQFGKGGCTAILATLSVGAPNSTPDNTMSAGIASLRVEGDRAFALYHGPKGVDYFVPMVKEGGKWKVGALEPTEFP